MLLYPMYAAALIADPNISVSIILSPRSCVGDVNSKK